MSLSLPGGEFSSQIHVLNAVLLVYMLRDLIEPKFRDQRERWDRYLEKLKPQIAGRDGCPEPNALRRSALPAHSRIFDGRPLAKGYRPAASTQGRNISRPTSTVAAR